MSAMTVVYPGGLLRWAGGRSGGVKRLFDEPSGRPSGSVIRTPLLARLEDWSKAIASSDGSAVTVVLLVGAPGNGKTEAIESVIEWLDRDLVAGGNLIASLRQQLSPTGSTEMPRIVSHSLGDPVRAGGSFEVKVVQDASVEDGSGVSRGRLLGNELADATGPQKAGTRSAYLCCVNRGVLDEALVETEGQPIKGLLQAIVDAVGVDATTMPCWPLMRHPTVAAWPMDIESLFVKVPPDGITPFEKILERATAVDDWPDFGTCIAGALCPFCTNRKVLALTETQTALTRILRWHEHSSGKRWTFRDCFSLVSSLLAGCSPSSSDEPESPCASAADLVRLDHERQESGSSAANEAIFKLAGSLFQHQLFGLWCDTTHQTGAEITRLLLRDCNLVGIADDPTALGIIAMVRRGRAYPLSSTVFGIVDQMCLALDPAVAEPREIFTLEPTGTFSVREIDERFSYSVSNGLEHLRASELFSTLELELLMRLADLDTRLGADVLRSNPARIRAAENIQLLIRDLASRWVKRSLGVRAGVVRDGEFFRDYEALEDGQRAPDGMSQELTKFVTNVTSLFDDNGSVRIAVDTTFGQPKPNRGMRAAVIARAPVVNRRGGTVSDRPGTPIQHLSIGTDGTIIPLTLDVFKAVSLLADKLEKGALPPDTRSMIDALLAKLSGALVRDRDGAAGTRVSVGKLSFRLFGTTFVRIDGGL